MGKWFAERCAFNSGLPCSWEVAQIWVSTQIWQYTTIGFPAFGKHLSEQGKDITAHLNLEVFKLIEINILPYSKIQLR